MTDLTKDYSGYWHKIGTFCVGKAGILYSKSTASDCWNISTSASSWDFWLSQLWGLGVANGF